VQVSEARCAGFRGRVCKCQSRPGVRVSEAVQPATNMSDDGH
jgi:hypothetical protein